MRQSILALFLVVALVSQGCSEGTDPSPGCVSVAGVWDVSMVGQTGTSLRCPDASLVWTISQTGCEFTVTSEAWGPATGGVWGSRLYAQWSWYQDCYLFVEAIDVVVDGGTMTGDYSFIRAQAVFPAQCPGVGMCSASLSGVRRAP